MRDFLLDTQTVRYWYDTACPRHSVVVDNIAKLRSLASSLKVMPKLLISVVTLGEIEFGHRVQVPQQAAHNSERSRFVREQLPEPLEIIRDVVEVYGELRARLFNRCAPAELRKPKMRPEQLLDPVTSLNLTIQENDLWICAQAVVHRMVLVTNDRMAAIREAANGLEPPLVLQNWTTAEVASLPA